jgi:hypothetical protein
MDVFHLRTGHERPEGEYRYSSTLSLTSAPDGVGGQRHTPTTLHPVYTYRTGDWVGPRVGVDGCGKSRLHWDSTPGQSSL